LQQLLFGLALGGAVVLLSLKSQSAPINPVLPLPPTLLSLLAFASKYFRNQLGVFSQ
jgi:hypothetical protein